MKMKWLLVMILAFVLAGCGSNPIVSPAAATATSAPSVSEDSGSVVVEGNIVPRDDARIYTRAGGMVADVLVKEGDVVQKDAVIVRLGDPQEAQAALAAANLARLDAQQALDKLNTNGDVSLAQAQTAMAAANKTLIDAQQKLADLDTATYQDDLDRFQQDVGTQRTALDDAQKEWDKYKDMDPSNQTRKDQERRFKDAQKKYDDAVRIRDAQINKLDQAKAEVETAKAAAADAQRELDKHKNGPNADDAALAQSRLDNATAQVTAAQAALDNLEIKAPFTGTIVEIDPVAGVTLLPSQQVALIADLGELYVETNDLTELDVVKVAVGDSASVRPDALSGLSLPATVTDIARDSGKKGGDVTYTVRLKLDKTDPELRWGMTVEVRFAQK